MHWEILWHFIGSILITITVRNRTHTVLVSRPNLCTIAVTFGGAQWFLFLFKKTLKWQCGRPFFPPHTLKLVCVQQSPAKARCIHTKIHTDLNHKIIHSVLFLWHLYESGHSLIKQFTEGKLFYLCGWDRVDLISKQREKEIPIFYLFIFCSHKSGLKRTI